MTELTRHRDANMPPRVLVLTRTIILVSIEEFAEFTKVEAAS